MAPKALGIPVDTRTARYEATIDTTALYFVDENLLKVDDVADRFNARYVVAVGPERRKMVYPRTLAEMGIRSLNLPSAVNLGFGTTEFLSARRFEERHRRPVASEEELGRAIVEDMRERFAERANSMKDDFIPEDEPDYSDGNRSRFS